MFSSSEIPNPLESLDQKMRAGSLGGKLYLALSKYVLVMFFTMALLMLILVVMIGFNLTKKPDYRLGKAIFEVVSPAPYSAVASPLKISVNVLTSEEAKNLKAFVKSGTSDSQEVAVEQVGQNVVGVSGVWTYKAALPSPLIEISLYRQVGDHPELINYTIVPVSNATQ